MKSVALPCQRVVPSSRSLSSRPSCSSGSACLRSWSTSGTGRRRQTASSLASPNRGGEERRGRDWLEFFYGSAQVIISSAASSRHFRQSSASSPCLQLHATQRRHAPRAMTLGRFRYSACLYTRSVVSQCRFWDAMGIEYAAMTLSVPDRPVETARLASYARLRPLTIRAYPLVVTRHVGSCHLFVTVMTGHVTYDTLPGAQYAGG
jgi:hypothetical protein